MTSVDTTTEAPAAAKIRATNPAFLECLEFLWDEAALLDDDLYHEWYALVTDDITYRMPVRQTVYRKDGDGFEELANHLDDDKRTLEVRVRRSVDIASAYDRDPVPRIRRIVSNMAVHQGATSDEYEVTSYVLLLRNRFDNPTYDVLSAKRQDVLRRTPDGMRLAKRLILTDVALLGSGYLNIFL